MRKNLAMIAVLLSFVISSQVFAIMDNKDINATGGYIQSIHVVNLLANTIIADPGMTSTPIIVKYYNGYDWPCWTTVLDFHQDTAVHAGPGLGCAAKINQVVVMPAIVADKLKTYRGPVSIDVDTSKYSTHLTVIQNQAPVFDNQNGLVINSGSVTIQSTAD